MTLTITHGGTDITDQILLENGILGLTSIADGGTAESGIRVDDPDGNTILLPLQELIVEEDACSDPRCFTGVDLNNKIDRGTYKSGPSRVWEMSIFDLNELLKRRILRGADANRPAETGSARIAWLLTTTGMAGVVHDNGAIAANSWTYEATDFRGQYALDVLESIVSASGELGRVFFVYWDHAAGEPSLFYASPNAVLNTSTLKISNVLSDVDDTTTFAPYVGSDLEAKGEAIYDGVFVNWTGGTTYLQRPSTFATYGVHVDGTFTWDRITNSTYALAHANTFLDRHAGQVDTITCTVRLPRDKVNFIDAGMRIEVKFEHIPGYTSWTFTRVTRRTLLLTAGTNLYYDLQLELSVRGIDQTGGGDPGEFPAPPTDCNPVVTQSVPWEDLLSSTSQVPISPPAASKMLYAFIAGRGTITGTPGCTDDGAGSGDWVEHPDSPLTPAGGSQVILRAYSKAATGDETLITIASGGSGNKSAAWVVETDALSTAEEITNAAAGAGPPETWGTGSFSQARGLVLNATVFNADDISHDYNATVGAGITEVADGTIDDNFSPGYFFGLASDSSGFTGTWNHNNGWAGLSYGIDCGAAEEVPQKGQWVFGEVVTLTGDDGTTRVPFADGSLTVYVDLTDQTAKLVSQNGLTGDFTLGFTPTPTEVTTVDYQVR